MQRTDQERRLASLQRRWLLLAAAFPWAASAHTSGGAHAASAAPKREQKPWGIAGTAKAVTRTVRVNMGDNMRFTPQLLQIKLGDTLALLVHNQGALLHEFVIGTAPELQAHAALMLKFPDMEHDEPYMAHVAPGKTGRVIWTFNRAGEFEFACLLPGHFSAGMKGRIVVLAPQQKDIK